MSIQEISVAFGLVVGVLIINPSHAAVENEYSAQIPTLTLHIPAKILGDYEIYDSSNFGRDMEGPRRDLSRILILHRRARWIYTIIMSLYAIWNYVLSMMPESWG